MVHKDVRIEVYGRSGNLQIQEKIPNLFSQEELAIQMQF